MILRLRAAVPLHYGLTDLRNNHFTDISILSWFQTSYQAGLKSVYGPNVLRNACYGTPHDQVHGVVIDVYLHDCRGHFGS